RPPRVTHASGPSRGGRGGVRNGEGVAEASQEPGSQAWPRPGCVASHLPPEILRPAPRVVHSRGCRQGFGLVDAERAWFVGAAETANAFQIEKLAASAAPTTARSSYWPSLPGRPCLPVPMTAVVSNYRCGAAPEWDPWRRPHRLPFSSSGGRHRNRRTQHIVVVGFVNTK